MFPSGGEEREEGTSERQEGILCRYLHLSTEGGPSQQGTSRPGGLRQDTFTKEGKGGPPVVRQEMG